MLKIVVLQKHYFNIKGNQNVDCVKEVYVRRFIQRSQKIYNVNVNSNILIQTFSLMKCEMFSN